MFGFSNVMWSAGSANHYTSEVVASALEMGLEQQYLKGLNAEYHVHLYLFLQHRNLRIIFNAGNLDTLETKFFLYNLLLIILWKFVLQYILFLFQQKSVAALCKALSENMPEGCKFNSPKVKGSLC